MIQADQQLFRWLNGFVGTWPWFDGFVKIIASDFLVPVLIAATGWCLWFLGRTRDERRRNQMGFIHAAAGAGLANLFVQFINHGYQRARPFDVLDHVNVLFYRPTDPSFPSNAAAFAFALAAGVWLANRRLGLVVAVAAGLFGIARVYAGMHFPLDIVGGALLGVLTTYLFSVVIGFFRPVVRVAFRIAEFFHLA